MKIQALSLALLLSQQSVPVASQTVFPYVVSLQDSDGNHFCGGSLIASDVVLSAATCGAHLYSTDTAVIGRVDLTTNEGLDVSIASHLPHPAYNDLTKENDVMLIFLRDPVPSNVQLVRLNSDDSSPQVGQTVAAWGLTNEDNSFGSDILMAVDVNAMSNTDCSASEVVASYAGQITDGTLCAADDSNYPCHGDSGGALVIEGGYDYQVGVVSWGFGCYHEESSTGVYTRVSTYYDWIRAEVCKNSFFAPADFKCDDIEVVDSPSGECTDTPNWVDSFGDDCSWYEVNDFEGCPSDGIISGPLGTAHDNCCHCGKKTDPPTPSPTFDDFCDDTPDWEDSHGDGCSWYKTFDTRGCPTYGDDFAGSMGVAKDNCCFCVRYRL